MQSTTKLIASSRVHTRLWSSAGVGIVGVLGCCAGHVCAADTVAAITPVAGTAMTANTVPAPAVIAPPLPQEPVLVTIDFTDAPVSDIVAMIGRQANVNILINEDVTSRIKSITLNDVTADQAIEYVAQMAGLNLTKARDNKTYILSKGLPASVATPSPGDHDRCGESVVGPGQAAGREPAIGRAIFPHCPSPAQPGG
jgi:type II secretory pathway component GspD/PulD (secretin)